MDPPRIELRTDLDEATLAEVLALIDVCTEADGHSPVGEHKHAHLRVGATGWVGIFAYDPADGLVGYAHTRWNDPGATPRMAVEVVVHPGWRARGVARRLLAETRAVLARAGGGTMYVWVHRVADPADTTPARMGFAVQRELAFMVRPLDELPEALPAPEGVEIRPYRPGEDDDAFLEVNNAAFGDHPENGNWDREEFARRRDYDWFEPEGLLMAWRGAELLGFHWTKWHGHDADEVPAHDPVGEVYVLATHPRARGMGLGRVLLRAGLAHLRGRGCTRAILYVDCANTAAVGLYESEGFTLVTREICYAEQVPARTDADADLRRPAS